MEKALIIDGNSILNRAFYGIRLLTNKNGLYTNAIYGMITMISRHIESLHPDYCAVAFDLKAPTFRHLMYDGYKATRKGMPEELAVQLPYAKDAMAKLGLTVVSCEGYEADDILGTLATELARQGKQVYILTGDRDSLQLIDGQISVLLAKTKETVLMDPAEFRNQYGLDSSVFVDVKALMGDSSDNIPGVAGIGEKTALKLIAEHGSIASLYEHLEDAGLSENMKNKLVAGKEMAFLSRQLAEICRTAPVQTDAEHYRYRGVMAKELRELFVELDFTALIKKFNLEQSEEQTPVAHRESEPVKVQEAACACELCGEIAFVALEGEAVSVFDGERLCRGDLASLCPTLRSKQIVCQDAKAFYRALSAIGADDVTCYFDCMLAAYVLDSGRGGYSLEDLSVRYLDEPLREDVSVAVSVARLYEVLNAEISKNGFEYLLYEIEMPLAKVLARMERYGFKIDAVGIEAYGRELAQAASDLQSRIYSYAGEEFNIGSPKQLGEVLFEKMGLPKSRKTKTGYSTDAETLQKLISKHPIIEDILDYRQVTKLKSTYADALVKVTDENGRVHSIFNQTGTATGRLSSSEPNLQNIPVRTELGRRFRQFFIPQSDDYVLIDADYSQIELRLLAHISDDEAMIDSFLSGEDIHSMTAAKVFSVPLDAVTGELRKKAKAVNFGIMYGIGEYSLSEDLGISRTQAKEYIESYFAQFPQIRAYLDRVVAEAHEKGYVTTFFGRRRYIPEIASSNKNLQHFGERVAMNSPIQGTAADIMKLAMIRVENALEQSGLDAKMILQVHDELLIESHKDCAEQVKALLVEGMEQAASLSIPLSVEANVGKNWFDAK